MHLIENTQMVEDVIELAKKEDILGIALYARRLKQKDIDLSQVCTYDGDTVLTWCLAHYQPELLKPLFAAGLHADSYGSYGRSLMHMCVPRKELDTMKMLLSYGANINIRDTQNEETPLHLCIKSNQQLDIFNFLLENGADINAQDSKGTTPLMLSILEDKESMMHCIMEMHPNLALTNKYNYDAFMVAREYARQRYANHNTALEFLARRGAHRIQK